MDASCVVSLLACESPGQALGGGVTDVFDLCCLLIVEAVCLCHHVPRLLTSRFLPTIVLARVITEHVLTLVDLCGVRIPLRFVVYLTFISCSVPFASIIELAIDFVLPQLEESRDVLEQDA